MYGIATASPSLAFPAAFSPSRRATFVTVRAAAAVAEPRTAERRSTTASSLYDVLRVQRTATPTEIKKAYRTLAKQYHPDCASGDLDCGLDFIDIHNAYETLSDPSARAVYDLSLLGGRRGSGYAIKSTSPYGNRRWETDQCW